jgi:hypothetical protein
MKDHSAEAMPIAFLAMHEEKTEAHKEIIAVWEEVGHSYNQTFIEKSHSQSVFSSLKLLNV